jgi:hypothetical protein
VRRGGDTCCDTLHRSDRRRRDPRPRKQRPSEGPRPRYGLRGKPWCREPGGIGPVSRPDIDILVDPDDPDRHRPSQCSSRPKRSDRQFFCSVDLALGALGYNLATAAYWHKAFPYKSSLTGVGGDELADGYEKSSGKQWTQQLGASLALFDAGFAALKASGDATNTGAVAKAIAGLNTTTIAGKVDFTSGPVPNVATGPIIGSQWVKAAAGSKFKLDLVITEHVTDPNVPIGAKLLPYNG